MHSLPATFWADFAAYVVEHHPFALVALPAGLLGAATARPLLRRTATFRHAEVMQFAEAWDERLSLALLPAVMALPLARYELPFALTMMVAAVLVSSYLPLAAVVGLLFAPEWACMLSIPLTLVGGIVLLLNRELFSIAATKRRATLFIALFVLLAEAAGLRSMMDLIGLLLRWE